MQIIQCGAKWYNYVLLRQTSVAAYLKIGQLLLFVCCLSIFLLVAQYKYLCWCIRIYRHTMIYWPNSRCAINIPDPFYFALISLEAGAHSAKCLFLI